MVLDTEEDTFVVLMDTYLPPWFWVKAHVGVTDSEAAHRLAKQCAALPEASVPVQF